MNETLLLQSKDLQILNKKDFENYFFDIDKIGYKIFLEVKGKIQNDVIIKSASNSISIFVTIKDENYQKNIHYYQKFQFAKESNLDLDKLEVNYDGKYLICSIPKKL